MNLCLNFLDKQLIRMKEKLNTYFTKRRHRTPTGLKLTRTTHSMAFAFDFHIIIDNLNNNYKSKVKFQQNCPLRKIFCYNSFYKRIKASKCEVIASVTCSGQTPTGKLRSNILGGKKRLTNFWKLFLILWLKRDHIYGTILLICLTCILV
jgi:hypothetical protein